MLLVVGMTALVLVAVAVPIAILVSKTVVERGKQDTSQQASSVGIYLRNAQRTTDQIRTHIASLSKSSGRPTSVLCPDGTLIGTLPEAAGTGGNTPPFTGPGNLPGGGPNGGGGDGDKPQLVSVSSGAVAVLRAGFGNNGYLVRVYASDSRLHSGETAWLLLLAGASAGHAAARGRRGRAAHPAHRPAADRYRRDRPRAQRRGHHGPRPDRRPARDRRGRRRPQPAGRPHRSS